MYEVSSLAYAYQQVFNIYHSKSIKRDTISSPAKRHLNGVSRVDR